MKAMIGSLYQYRGFILRSAWKEIRYRYAGSGIGIFWNILIPLIQIAIYAFIFSAIMSARVAASGAAAQSRYTFVLYLCAGMLPWQAFVDCIGRGTSALVRNANYLQKMALPESIFIAQSSLAGLLTAAIALGLFFLIGWPLGLTVGWSYLLLPVVLMLFQGFGFGLALSLATLNALFRDIGQLIGLLLQMWMWLTPIVYAETILPPSGQALIRWKPANGIITSFHDIFLHNRAPAFTTWGMMLGWALASLILGNLILEKLRFEVRDVL
jgi:ABC-type polysaccharide/polyol phosphate export permease